MRTVDRTAMLVPPKPGCDPAARENIGERLPKLRAALVGVRAEELVVAHQEDAMRSCIDVLAHPVWLWSVEPVFVVGGIEPEDLPVVVLEAEPARMLLPREAWLGEEKVEVAVARSEERRVGKEGRCGRSH